MQTISHKKTTRGKPSDFYKAFVAFQYKAMVKYSRPHSPVIQYGMRSLSLQPASVSQIRSKVAIREKLRRREAGKEVVMRALMPPIRKPRMRWLNFQPSPSRLSSMSMA